MIVAERKKSRLKLMEFTKNTTLPFYIQTLLIKVLSTFYFQAVYFIRHKNNNVLLPTPFPYSKISAAKRILNIKSLLINCYKALCGKII